MGRKKRGEGGNGKRVKQNERGGEWQCKKEQEREAEKDRQRRKESHKSPSLPDKPVHDDPGRASRSDYPRVYLLAYAVSTVTQKP